MPVTEIAEIQSDAPTISYDDIGHGDTVLWFMPGWCVSRKVFMSLPELCAQSHRVLSLDWRGHGESGAAIGDFGNAGLLQDALAVMRAAGVTRIGPVAHAHAWWVALELRRRLGLAVSQIVLLDWLVTEPPPVFLDTLRALQRPVEWERARESLFSMWTHDACRPELERFIRRDMGSYDFAMWSRAAREIQRAYATFASPLRAMSPAPMVLHAYAQPEDAGFLSIQRSFASQTGRRSSPRRLR
jgi:pimeloyl-ACP methyl ester carboxylesterase